MTLTIKDVRAKYPDYEDLSDEQLAEALHKKYYSDMPQADFYSAIGLERMDIKESPRPKPRPSGPAPEVVSQAPAMPQPVQDPAMAALATAMGADTPPMIGAPPQLVAPSMRAPANMTAGPMRSDAPPPVMPTVETALGAQPARATPDATPEWIKAAMAAKAAGEPQYDPLLSALATEVGNTPERVKRGFAGNSLASAESRLVDAVTAIGVAKDPAGKLAEVSDQRKAIEAQIINAGPGERVQLEGELVSLRDMEKRLQDLAGNADLADTREATARSRMETAQRDRQSSQAYIDEQTAALIPSNPMPGLDQAIVSGVSSFGDMAPGLVTTLVTRNPLPMMLYLAGYSRGSTYADKRAEGYDSDKSASAANLYALSEAIPEYLPIAKLLERGTGAVAKVAGTAVSEAASEAFTSALQSLVDVGVLDKKMTWGQAAANMAESSAAGGVMGLLSGAGAAGMDAGRAALENRKAKEGTPADSNAPALTSAPAAPPQKPKTPEEELAAAMGATPAPPVQAAPLTAPATATPTPAATAQAPDSGSNFRIMDEVENNADGKSVPTGRKVRVDLTTGQATVVGAEETPAQAGGAPVAPQSDGQQPQVPSAPVVGNDAPPAAGRTPEDELAATMGPTSATATTAAPAPAQPAPEKVPARNQPSNVEFLDQNDVQKVQTDAATFQYKAGGDQDGMTDRLRGVTKWDTARAGMALIYERADGSRYIADGHQRLGLAKRLSSEGKPVQMTAIILRETDGVTPQEARAQAALKNIAEGSGTATDAAKVLRDSNATPQELGLPPNSAIVRDAMGMRNLSDQAFGMIVNGIVTEAEGGLVGRVVKDSALHADILGLLKRLKPSNAFQAEAIVRQAMEATSTETQTSLFGDEDVQTNLYLERAKILDGAVKRVRDDLKTFKTLVDRAETVSGAGNVLNADANAQRLATDTAVRDYMSSQANMKGPISDALTAAARAYRADKRIGTAIDAFVRAVEGTMDQGGSGSAGGDPVGQALRPVGAGSADQGSQGQPDQAVTPETAPAPEADLFAPTQTGKTPEQIRAEAEADVRKNQSKIRKAGGNDGDAGPLFNPEVDLFSAPAPQVEPQATAAEAFIAKSKALRAELQGKAVELEPFKYTTDKTDGPVGQKLETDLAAASGFEARKAIADDFVLASGIARKVEHMVVLGNDGELIAFLVGKRDGVEFSDNATVAAAAGLIGYTVHNHPRNTGLSGGDFRSLFNGFGPLAVMGHDGARHVATLTDAAKALRNGIGVEAFDVMNDTITTDWNRQVAKGTLPFSVKVANQQHMNLLTVAMARIGLIDYQGTAEADLARNGVNFDDYFATLQAAVSPTLRRAGFSLPSLGDRGGDNAAGTTGPGAGSDGGVEAAAPNPDLRNGEGRLPSPELIQMTPPPARGGDGKPAKKPSPKELARQRLASIEAYFTPGNIIASYGGNADRVLSFNKGGNGDWTVTVESVVKNDAGEWVKNPADLRERTHRTTPTDRELKAGPIERGKTLPVETAKPSSGNAAIDSALDDLFGDEPDVQRPGERVERDSGNAGSSDGVGTADVSASAGQSGPRGAKRAGPRGKRNGQQGAGSGLPAGDAAALGVAGDQGLGGAERPSGQPAAGGNGGSGNGDSAGRLPSGAGGTQDAAGNAAGGATGVKRDAAARLSAIRNILKEDLLDFIARPSVAEDVSSLTDTDPRKYDALEAVFVEALDGIDTASASDKELFRAIILPLRDAGMTRAEVVELTPYLESFLSNLRAGRVNLTGEAPVADHPTEQPSRSELQAKADRIKPIAADEANIRATLPLLLPEQQDDVLKVERRYAKPDGNGMMITNGTGTGKTYSGGGVIKRFVQQGKGNILIVAPSEAVIAGWSKALDALGVPVSQLRDTKDAGQGVVITTYANLRDNNALAARDFDLIVTDESQNLMSSQSGEATGALRNLRALSKRSLEDLRHRSRMIHAADWARLHAMKDGEAKTATYRSLTAREEGEIAKWSQQPKSKVLFLSATPFAYDKTVDYAEGYLFDYPKDGRVNRSNQSGRNLFMVQHFGYRIRYHKLTKPEAAVDSAVFEREFHEKLVRDGVLTGRSLQIDVDYDRKFSLVADGLGTKIDSILSHIWEGSSNPDREIALGYQNLQSAVMKKFDYLKRMQLLEAIKAKAAVEDIQKHLAMGRKVVVFHDYNVGGGFNPFSNLAPIDDANAVAAAADLLRAFPDLHTMDFSSYGAPVDTLLAAFPQAARAFNGTIPQKKRLNNLTDFNTDGSGADVLIVQADAGGAGISMHDTTGNHQRVLINLGMPTKPTTTLQEEGRILRVGTLTNAPFRYYTIGTAWERTAFATRIAERSGTVENLALGNQARDLLTGFIDAYMEAEALEPSVSDGTGGKERDRSSVIATPFEKAKTHYFGRVKTSGRRDQRDGLDFYPTPEPLAFKMVDWAGIRPNERVLEPSAGDGSIARYTPDHAAVTMIEPSADLLSTALLRTPHGKAEQGTFENYHLVNKHHVIVMNPPFGSGGKAAMEHLAKAARHVRDGGRIVALIPTGPAADKRWNDWWNSDNAKEFNFTADISLPSVAFEKAGTGVMTRVVILDRINDKDERAYFGARDGGTKRLNFTGASSIKEFFDRIEQYDVPRRPDPKADVLDEMEAEGQDATAPMPQPVMAPPLAAKDSAFTLKQTKHSKTGEALFVATIVDRVERDAYTAILAVAKAHGGYYSNFRGNGAIPGFQFKSEADRQAFLDDMKKPTLSEGGDVFGSDDENFAATFMAELAQVDDLFQNPRSTGTTLQAVFADIDPSIKVEGVLPDGDPRLEEKDAEEVIFARTAKGMPFYVMQDGKQVWIDVSELSQGDGGSAIYAAVSEYALNTGRVFIGDPAGLSLKALRRRTDNMLSTALKHGTTKHIEPHPDQIVGNPKQGVPALQWTEGDDLGNVASLIDASAANAIHLVPDIADARYDFQTATFTTGDGQPLTDGDLDKWASSAGRSGTARVGRNTVKRGILLNSLARTEVQGRPGLLERALRQPRQLVARGLARTFYQVTPPQMVREAAVATEEIMRLAPELRAELDRLDLGRVRLFVAPKARGYQGMFQVTGDGGMEITIAASMDPMKTLHHEVIHALRAMNLFTPAEWLALELAAQKGWMEKHDIAARYPDLLPSEQIEEAIAEEFSEALEAKRAPKGSALVTAFNKIARLFRAIRNVFQGAGFTTAEDIFGQILAGEISKRQAGNTGAMLAMGQRPSMSEQRPRAVRPLTAQARAHRNSGMGGALFLPDRRIWEELTRSGASVWERLRGGGAGVMNWVDRVRVNQQDRFLPLLRAQEVIQKATGKKLPPDQLAYLKETTFSGKAGNHLLEIDEEFTKPIIKLIAKSKGLTSDDVGEWLYARHAIERNAYIASINLSMPDGGSGMMDADAQQILSEAAAGPHAATLNQIGDLVDQLRERTLKLREDKGLLTHDEARLWRSQYKHYVPLKGYAETDHAEAVVSLQAGNGTGRGFSVRGGESRRALGRQSEAFNPLVTAIAQAKEAAIRAEKNAVGQALYELAKSYPSKALWEVKTPKQRQYYNRSTGMVETRVEDPLSMILEPNEIAVKIGGTEHRILFLDERLAEAMVNLGVDQWQGVIKYLGRFSRMFSMVNTTLSPVFVLKNAIRDFASAQIRMWAWKDSSGGAFELTMKQRRAIMWAMTKNWRKAVGGAWRAQGYRFDSKWSKYFKEFQQAGAQVSFWTLESPEASVTDLDRRIRLARGNAAVRGIKAMSTPSAFFSSRDNPVLQTIERVNLSVDNGIRLAAFVEAREQGLTVDQAAFLSKELTVNFNRRGRFGAAMNAAFPFFNAAVQGGVVTLQALSNWKMLAGLTFGGIGLGMLMEIVNAALSDEDDDGALAYDKLPDYRNRTNLHFPLPESDKMFGAIPMPYGFNIFPYAGQQMAKVWRGVKSEEAAFADVAAATAQSYLPMDTLVPTIFNPMVEVWKNENYFGSAIYPEDIYGNNKYLPDAAKFFPSASEASKAVAMAVNKATLGSEVESGWVDISPEVIDHVMAFAVGGAGRFWGNGIDNLAKVLSGKADEIEVKDVPFANAVMSEVSPWEDKDRFKIAKYEVENANHDIGKWPEGMTVPKDVTDKAGLYEKLLRAERELKGQGEFNPENTKIFERLPRDERTVILEFNKEYSVIDKQIAD